MALTQPRIRFSGGSINQAAIQSLGGGVSMVVNTGIGSQKLVWTTTSMSGVTLCEGHNIPLGEGTLSYDPGTGLLTLIASESSEFAVTLGSDGLYHVGNNGFYFIVHVITSLLPTAGYTERGVTVLSFKNAAFDDVLNDERSSGRTEYRCFYLCNENLYDDLLNPQIMVTDPTLGDMWVAKEYVYSGTSGVMTPQAFFRYNLECTEVFTFMTEEYRAASPFLDRINFLPTVWPINHEGAARDQDSDGFSTDVSPMAVDERDSTGVTGGLEFTTKISWKKIKPGRFVSFWLKRVVPYASTGALIHDVSDLTFTYTP